MPPLPSNRKSNRKRAERRGRFGERLAALHLRLKLYRIVARRVKTPLGEIDLIARKGDVLAIVEVKTRRRSGEEEQAQAAVNRKRIIRAAKYYLSGHPRFAGLTVRFDLMFLAPLAWPKHFKNAFEDS